MLKPVYWRATTRDDIDYLAQHMRQADVDELRASHGDYCNIRDIVKAAVDSCELPETGIARDTGELIVMRGVTSQTLLSDTGTPWALGTERMFEFHRQTLVDGRRYIRDMLRRYHRLENYVDARNTKCVKYIGMIGFKLDEPKPYGLKGLPFHRFVAEQ